MGLFGKVVAAYREPLRDLTRHHWQPVEGGRLTCPLTGARVEEATCVVCPRYVRSALLPGTDLWPGQPAVVCDPGPARDAVA